MNHAIQTINQKQNSVDNSLRIVLIALKFIVKIKHGLRTFHHRNSILKQWFSLQSNYFRQLQLICTFIFPFLIKELKSQRQQLQKMCSIFVQLKDHSNSIIVFLKSAKDNPKLFYNKLGQICSSYGLYTIFFKNNLNSLDIVNRLYRQQPITMKNMDKLIRQKQIYLSLRQFSFRDYLQKPSSKMFQILLLLAEHSKYISLFHLNSQIINQAQEIIHKINKHCNSVIKVIQIQKNIEKIEKLLGQKIFNQFYDKVQGQSFDGKVQIYLFEQLIALVSNKSTKVNKIYLNHHSRIVIKNVINQQNCVLVIGEERSITLFFDNMHDYDKFLRVIYQIIPLEQILQAIRPNLPFIFTPFFNITVMHHLQLKKQNSLSIVQDDVFLINFSCLKRQNYQSKFKSEIHLIQQARNSFQDSLFLKKQAISCVLPVRGQTILLLKNRINQSEWSSKISLQIKNQSFLKYVSRSVLKMLVVEQYINQIFIRKQILKNPIWILKMFNLPDLLLNSSLSLQSSHRQCLVCNRIRIRNMKDYFKLKTKYLSYKYSNCIFYNKKQIYCNEILKALMMNIDEIELKSLSSRQEVLSLLAIKNGDIDYVFRPNRQMQFYYKIQINILSMLNVCYQILIDKVTVASEVIDNIAYIDQVASLENYRLFAVYQGQQKLIYRDQNILEVAELYNIPFQKIGKTSLISKLKRISSLLQFFERGYFLLKRVIMTPQNMNTNKKEWQFEQIAFNVKNDLVPLHKKDLVSLAILFSFRASFKAHQSSNRWSQYLSIYLPHSIDQTTKHIEIISKKMNDDKISENLEDINKKIQTIQNSSILNQTMHVKMKVRSLPHRFSGIKKIQNIILGLRWNSVILLRQDFKIIDTCPLGEVIMKLFQCQLHIEMKSQNYVLAGINILTIISLWPIYQAQFTYYKTIK